MKARSIENYLITEEQRAGLIAQLGKLLKSELSLQQSCHEQKEIAIASNEEFYLEILEVMDTLESLIGHLTQQPELSSQQAKRLPKSLTSIQNKLLAILERRQVIAIKFQEEKPDSACCRVVDCEIRDDLEEQTITQIVRQGFYSGEKVLRPVEVITAKHSPL
jgi:molecular chaperone GrpE